MKKHLSRRSALHLSRQTISNLKASRTNGGITGALCENYTVVDPKHTRQMNLSCGYTMMYNCTVSVAQDCPTVGTGCYITNDCVM